MPRLDFKALSCMADLIPKSLHCVAGAERILITNFSYMSEDMTFAFIPLYLKRPGCLRFPEPELLPVLPVYEIRTSGRI